MDIRITCVSDLYFEFNLEVVWTEAINIEAINIEAINIETINIEAINIEAINIISEVVYGLFCYRNVHCFHVNLFVCPFLCF